MANYVDLGTVEAGCTEIDNAINRFSDVSTKIMNASSLLDKNNLKFGSINSSLDEQLDILSEQVEKCSVMNEGVTATIRANAEAQYQEYLAWLKDKNETDNVQNN